MAEYLNSDLIKRLVQDGLRGAGAATPVTHGIGDGANAGKRARRHQPANRGGSGQPMGMLMGKGARLIRHTPFLMIIDGGKV